MGTWSHLPHSCTCVFFLLESCLSEYEELVSATNINSCILPIKKNLCSPTPLFCITIRFFHFYSYIITSFFDCQMLEDHPQIRNGVQLSVVQGYMSNFYRSLKCHWCSHWYSQNDLWHCVYVFMFRRYGTWVARNPTLVLCSSLAMVLVLCLGLIRFKVETRPEKVWFGA